MKTQNTVKAIVRMPAFAMCYIHNGDTDNITDKEVEMIDQYIEDLEIVVVGMPDSEPFFSSAPWGTNFLAGDYYDVECLVKDLE